MCGGGGACEPRPRGRGACGAAPARAAAAAPARECMTGAAHLPPPRAVHVHGWSCAPQGSPHGRCQGRRSSPGRPWLEQWSCSPQGSPRSRPQGRRKPRLGSDGTPRRRCSRLLHVRRGGELVAPTRGAAAAELAAPTCATAALLVARLHAAAELAAPARAARPTHPRRHQDLQAFQVPNPHALGLTLANDFHPNRSLLQFFSNY